MNKLLYFLCLLLLFMGCSGSSMKTDLDTYERSIDRDPQATYELLTGMQPVTAEDRARHALLAIKAKNMAYVPLGARDTAGIMYAIDYYKSRMDTKQVMLGYYLLGSIYRDLGDASRGVEAFMKVIEVADTSKADCDYRIMARAEAQKSDLQSFQAIYDEALQSSYRAEYYAWQARDTSYAFDCAFESIGINALRRNYSPLVSHGSHLIDSCLAFGDTLLVVDKIISLAWYYLQIGMTDEAAKMLRFYDDNHGKPYPMYYGTKGELYLARHQTDTAEWCFRMEQEATDWNNRQAAYRGLKKVFEQRHQSDSALKYATLQCDAVDSDYQRKISEDIVRMEKVYNYEIEKEQRHRSENRLQRHKWLTALSGIGAFAIVLIALFSIRMLRGRYRRIVLLKMKKNRTLKAQLAENDKLLAQEKCKRKDAESKAMQTERYVMEVRTELQQLECERDKLRLQLMVLKDEQAACHDAKVADKVRIHELEQRLQQKDMEIREVRQEVDCKNQELHELQEQLEQMHNEVENLRKLACSMENYSDGVQQMRQQLKDKKSATVRNWMALQSQVLKLHPTFVKSIRTLVKPLLEHEFRIAMLVRTGFHPSEIAILMNRSPQMVSMSRRRLYAKAFGREPENLKDVDEWIMTI